MDRADASPDWAADIVATLSTNATAFRDIIQPDGKIVAIGTSGSGGQVVRYNADGTLDTGFGTGGIATTGGNWLIDGVIQSDGKIIAVGAGGGDYYITRLNTNGSADTSFGSGGSVSVDFGASEYAMVEVVDAEMMLGKKKAADLAASGYENSGFTSPRHCIGQKLRNL